MGYYFIGIGGSGAKVMESLAHLCAMGLMPHNAGDKIYMMAVDPDGGNGNLRRTQTALQNLQQFQSVHSGKNTDFLQTKVELASPFVWSPTEHDKKLDEIMFYQLHKDQPLGDLYEILYTREERNTLLNEGFRGRPSIGAAVMAEKAKMFNDVENIVEPWKQFVQQVNADAKTGEMVYIFLAGSVFGGTGAAGMPTLSRILRDMFKDNDNVVIGGSFILPYFSFTPTAAEQEEARLFASSENFLTNTKAALKYYAVKEKAYDSMYFIGDQRLAPVGKFSIGAASQNNDAHIVDFYGALAALDFFSAEKKSDLKMCSYIAYAKKENRGEQEVLTWTDFPRTRVSGAFPFKEKFAQFTRFILSYVHLIKPILPELMSGKAKPYQYPWYMDYFADSPSTSEMAGFHEYTDNFMQWLAQLEKGEINEVDFISKNVFQTETMTVNPFQFEQLVCGETSEVTLDELWKRLAEHAVLDDEDTSGFGRFLRALYDCCKEGK